MKQHYEEHTVMLTTRSKTKSEICNKKLSKNSEWSDLVHIMMIQMILYLFQSDSHFLNMLHWQRFYKRRHIQIRIMCILISCWSSIWWVSYVLSKNYWTKWCTLQLLNIMSQIRCVTYILCSAAQKCASSASIKTVMIVLSALELDWAVILRRCTTHSWLKGSCLNVCIHLITQHFSIFIIFRLMQWECMR